MVTKPFALSLAFLLCMGVGFAATHHRPLSGAIGSRQAPIEPIVGQAFVPPSSSGGSLVSHGQFLYVLLGDKVYKLDPKDLRVLSVRRLSGVVSSASAAPVVKKKRVRRHPVRDDD
jgi:hypothetical protein